MEQIRIARLVDKKKIALFKEMVDPNPAAGEAVVRVHLVGICGTDMHIFCGKRDDVVLPRIMGHELSGEVIAIGEGVSNVCIGDRVVLDPVMACGKCKACRSGYANVCADVKCYGVQMDGGFRDLITVPAAQLYRIPDGVSDEDAALIEPFSIASNILERAQAKNGEKLVIIGAGTVGLTILQGAKGMGLEVLISDMVDTKLEKARSMGADVVLNNGQENLAEKVAVFAPEGPDIVIDAVGIAPLLEQCIDLCGPRSRVVVIGFDGTKAAISPVQITKRELTLVGSRMNAHRFPEALCWFANKTVNPSAMIEKIFPVEEIQQAFEIAVSNPSFSKILIRFK